MAHEDTPAPPQQVPLAADPPFEFSPEFAPAPFKYGGPVLLDRDTRELLRRGAEAHQLKANLKKLTLDYILGSEALSSDSGLEEEALRATYKIHKSKFASGYQRGPVDDFAIQETYHNLLRTLRVDRAQRKHSVEVEEKRVLELMPEAPRLAHIKDPKRFALAIERMMGPTIGRLQQAARRVGPAEQALQEVAEGKRGVWNRPKPFMRGTMFSQAVNRRILPLLLNVVTGPSRVLNTGATGFLEHMETRRGQFGVEDLQALHEWRSATAAYQRPEVENIYDPRTLEGYPEVATTRFGGVPLGEALKGTPMAFLSGAVSGGLGLVEGEQVNIPREEDPSSDFQPFNPDKQQARNFVEAMHSIGKFYLDEAAELAKKELGPTATPEQWRARAMELFDEVKELDALAPFIVNPAKPEEFAAMMGQLGIEALGDLGLGGMYKWAGAGVKASTKIPAVGRAVQRVKQSSVVKTARTMFMFTPETAVLADYGEQGKKLASMVDLAKQYGYGTAEHYKRVTDEIVAVLQQIRPDQAEDLLELIRKGTLNTTDPKRVAELFASMPKSVQKKWGLFNQLSDEMYRLSDKAGVLTKTVGEDIVGAAYKPGYTPSLKEQEELGRRTEKGVGGVQSASGHEQTIPVARRDPAEMFARAGKERAPKIQRATTLQHMTKMLQDEGVLITTDSIASINRKVLASKQKSQDYLSWIGSPDYGDEAVELALEGLEQERAVRTGLAVERRAAGKVMREARGQIAAKVPGLPETEVIELGQLPNGAKLKAEWEKAILGPGGKVGSLNVYMPRAVGNAMAASLTLEATSQAEETLQWFTAGVRAINKVWRANKTIGGGYVHTANNAIGGVGQLVMLKGLEAANPLIARDALFGALSNAGLGDKFARALRVNLPSGENVDLGWALDLMRDLGVNSQYENITGLSKAAGGKDLGLGRKALHYVVDVPVKAASKPFIKANNVVEDATRLAIFLHTVKSTKPEHVAAAIDKVHEFAGLYNRLSSFEKQYMSEYAIMFYPWFKTAARSLSTTLYNNPQRLDAFYKLQTYYENLVPVGVEGKDEPQSGFLTMGVTAPKSAQIVPGAVGKFNLASPLTLLGQEEGDKLLLSLPMPLLRAIFTGLTNTDPITGKQVPLDTFSLPPSEVLAEVWREDPGKAPLLQRLAQPSAQLLPDEAERDLLERTTMTLDKVGEGLETGALGSLVKDVGTSRLSGAVYDLMRWGWMSGDENVDRSMTILGIQLALLRIVTGAPLYYKPIAGAAGQRVEDLENIRNSSYPFR